MSNLVLRFVPTEVQRNTVEMAVAVGLSQETICRLIINPATGQPVDVDTLRRYFREEIDTGAARANLNVGASIYKRALAGSVGAAIWWSKNRMGWRDYIEQQTNVTASFEVTDARSRIASRIDAIARRADGRVTGEGTQASFSRFNAA